jgi:hypothetical protein
VCGVLVCGFVTLDDLSTGIRISPNSRRWAWKIPVDHDFFKHFV